MKEALYIAGIRTKQSINLLIMLIMNTKKTSELKQGDTVVYYGAEFVVMNDAVLVRDYDINQQGACDTSIKTTPDMFVYGAECTRVDTNKTGLDDILNGYKWMQGTDYVEWGIL